MHKIVNNLISIKSEIKKNIQPLATDYNPEIIAVSKTFPMSDILPLINYGHMHFGENKVQESIEKWDNIKIDFKDIKLHMLGKLQTNKVKYVLPLFDYIHSLDNLRLAEKIANEEVKINKKINIFIQINIGNESQKNGINSDELESFYKRCTQDLGLKIIGLMCIPPNDFNILSNFLKMKNLLNKIQLPELSMGMSNDYMEAINYKATFLRIGSKIFGNRN
ncbi:MAG: hypothetical protein FD548_000047 [Pelagibacterales bacterium]|nr:hypothetical protein [Pelagibacterales bacterium]